MSHFVNMDAHVLQYSISSDDLKLVFKVETKCNERFVVLGLGLLK